MTHGGMAYGAAAVAARQFGASLVSPLSAAKGSISETFRKYPHLQEVLPAMGYSDLQRKELQETINAVQCDIVLNASPIDIAAILKLRHPVKRVRYELDCPELEKALRQRLEVRA